MDTVGTGARSVEEYKTLRDETLRRVDARNQTLSFTLVFAASMFTLALGTNGYTAALLVYPVVAFFFATAFAYNSLMLIEIGSYLRTLETGIEGLGWAAHLKPRYRYIEILELISSAGLFVGTECIGMLLYYTGDPVRMVASTPLNVVGWIAVALTIVVVFYPWIYHRFVLKNS